MSAAAAVVGVVVGSHAAVAADGVPLVRIGLILHHVAGRNAEPTLAEGVGADDGVDLGADEAAPSAVQRVGRHDGRLAPVVWVAVAVGVVAVAHSLAVAAGAVGFGGVGEIPAHVPARAAVVHVAADVHLAPIGGVVVAVGVSDGGAVRILFLLPVSSSEVRGLADAARARSEVVLLRRQRLRAAEAAQQSDGGERNVLSHGVSPGAGGTPRCAG